MADGRKNNGAKKGENRGQGRKPKADELKKIELMDSVLVPLDAWKALAEKVKEGDATSIKAWIDHRFGKAKESKDISHEYTGTLPAWLNNEIDE